MQRLAERQDAIVGRIAELTASLTGLKERMAAMDEPGAPCDAGALRARQDALLERIRRLNDEIRTITAALNCPATVPTPTPALVRNDQNKKQRKNLRMMSTRPTPNRKSSECSTRILVKFIFKLLDLSIFRCF